MGITELHVFFVNLNIDHDCAVVNGSVIIK